MAEIIVTGPKSIAIITVAKESKDYWQKRFDSPAKPTEKNDE